MSNEKKKKTMYVPDEEVLAYSKNKAIDKTAETELPADETVTDAIVDEITEVSKAKTETTDVSANDTDKGNKKDNLFIRIIRLIFPFKGDSIKRIIIKCIALIAALALIISATYLSLYFIDLGQQDAKIENIRNTYELNRDDYSRNEDNQFSKFDKLKSLNSDVIGWLTIPNTEVNNPVYQTIDNQYYVTHDMDKQSNSYGALFLDYRCDINPMSLSQNQIIYGHNMRYGAMFGTLKEYRSLDFYKSNPLIYFDSLYEQRVYKIFAIMIVNDKEDETFGYSYSAYRNTFTSEDDFGDWIEYSRHRSLFDIPVDVTVEDEIVTLSTCCYDYDNARFVIMGRLVRPDESTEVSTGDAVKNPDVIYSKEYYSKKGMKIPEHPSNEAKKEEEKK